MSSIFEESRQVVGRAERTSRAVSAGSSGRVQMGGPRAARWFRSAHTLVTRLGLRLSDRRLRQIRSSHTHVNINE